MATPLEETDRPICYRVENAGATPPEPTDGAKARYRTSLRSLGGMQKEAVVSAAGSDVVWRLASDEGDYLDGADEAPPPLGYMLAGMASAYAAGTLEAAEANDVAIADLTVVLDNYYSMDGSALAGTMTASAEPPELRVEVEADADEPTVEALVASAVDASPVTGVLRERLPSGFSLTVNGEAVSPDGVAALDEPGPGDPSDRFEDLGPADADGDASLVRHTGEVTEPLAEADDRYTERGDSTLADEHDRVVHLRGICTPAPDGTLSVRQKTYSPRASMFDFVADPGGTAAPDPLAYVSAGIGFCFMTQMGRYASVVGEELPGYRVVQDTGFAPGDPEDGSVGRATPVESHVYLETPAGADFGREVLDMSEQSCYLHALYRSEIEPSVTVSTS